MSENYLLAAMIECQEEGTNPSLSEMIDKAEELKKRAQWLARVNGQGVIEDFLSMAEDALERLEGAGLEGSEIDLLLKDVSEYAGKRLREYERRRKEAR